MKKGLGKWMGPGEWGALASPRSYPTCSPELFGELSEISPIKLGSGMGLERKGLPGKAGMWQTVRAEGPFSLKLV